VILTNGRIYTLDPASPRIAGLPITRDGRVARGVEAWEGDVSQVSSERIDLDGRTVLPGLVDAHVHFRTWAIERSRVDLQGSRSVREVAERAAAAPGDWVIGQGWRATDAGAEPDAALLDEICGDRPVALWAHDRHTLVLSSRAQELTGAAAPGGVLREHEAWDVPLPEPSPAAALAAVDAAQATAHAAGVTQVHDFERHGGFAIWQQLHADRSLTLRVTAAQQAEGIAGLRAAELRTGFGDAMLQVGPVKAFLDGTLGSRTARMLEPFADGGDGLELMARDDFAMLIREAAGGGLAVAVHAIGDRACREALDAFEETRDVWQPTGLRQRIEHAQLLHPDDVARFGALGVIASMQPTHAPSDRDVADRAWGDRAALAYAWRALADAGATLAFGSDAPIEPLAPLAGIHAAVNRTLDDRPAWHPEQALTVLEAVAGFTRGAASAAGWERHVGRLAPGCEADLVVLDDDPFTCPPGRIASIGVVATMVGGRWVHGRPPW
jgi:predicted amidohydrolase YtcJ